MEIDKDLAESWTVSPDARTFTFTLRRGVRWQDGQPFSAQDVKFTFELWAHPEWPGPLSANLATIEGAQAYKDKKAPEITGIKIVGNRVQFTLAEPSAVFLAGLALSIMLPRHLLKDVPPADVQKHPFARKPVYTGPFMVDAWRTGEGLTFTGFPDHYAGRPRLEAIVGRNIPEPAAALAELRTGGVQLGTVTPDHLESFARDPAFRTQQLAGGGGWFLQLDLTNPLFSDRRVRQAMSHAIDRKAIIDSLFRGRAELNSSIASPLSWIYNPSIPKFEFDAARARALLDEAGWSAGPDGVRTRGGRRLEFTLNCTARTRDWAVAIQPFLRSVGIAIRIDVLEFGTWIQRLRVGAHEASVGGWINFIIDPRADLAAHFLSPRPVDASGYRNDRVDRLFKQARTAGTRAQEKKIYDEIQAVTARDAVYVYLWRPADLLVTRSTLIVPEVKTLTDLYSSAPRWELRA
jgi:peptide/nickel transport system substrate-binding protein